MAAGIWGAAALAVMVATGVTAQTAAPRGTIPLVPVSEGPVTKRPLPRYVSLKTQANARRGPGLDHRVDWIFLHRRMPLQVVAEFENWRRVVDADGTGGWVHYSLLRGDRTVVVRSPETTLRAEPSESAPVRALARQGVIAELGPCQPLWCEVEVDGFAGWVPKADVWGVEAGELRE